MIKKYEKYFKIDLQFVNTRANGKIEDGRLFSGKPLKNTVFRSGLIVS